MSAPARPGPDGSRNVLVVGMHRSGTSVTTRVINGLGLATCVPEDLFTNPYGNETGHWESTTLTELNDDLLGEIGSAWWCPPPVAEQDRIAPALASRVGAATLALKTTHPDTPWVWKDPRNCLLLPFWRGVLEAPPVVVLALRNPSDICTSLERRNHFPLHWSLALVERYLGHALRGLAGLPVVCTRYELLIRSPQRWIGRVAEQLGDLGVAVALPDLEDVRALVEASLQHGGRLDTEVGDLPLAPEQHDLIEAAFHLDEAYERFPHLELPPDSAAARAGLEQATRHLPTGAALSVPTRPTESNPVPEMCVIVTLGAGGAEQRRSVLGIVATTPPGGEVRLVGPGAEALAEEMSGLVGDLIDVRSADGSLARPETIAAICDRTTANRIVFTTDAVQPDPRWAEALGGVLDDPAIGAAGPILSSSSGTRLQGLTVTDVALNARWIQGVPTEVRDVPMLTRYFMAVDRDTLAEVGGVDGLMSPDHGMWDWELCVRLWRAGYRVVAVPHAAVTVQFDHTVPPSDPAFFRNVLRFAALHLDRRSLADVIASLDGTAEMTSVIHDVFSDDAGRTRALYRRMFPGGVDEATNHVLAACRTNAT